MGTVARGWSATESLDRGQTVVVRSSRGRELGEVLGLIRTASPEPATLEIERVADTQDRHAATQAAGRAAAWMARCQAIFGEGRWPIAIVDVEPLLDPMRAVVYYLGPGPFATEGLRTAVWERHGMDLVFEPVNLGTAAASCDGGGCGSCGAGEESSAGCGTSAGCAGCAVARRG
jgi:hypothetical protein